MLYWPMASLEGNKEDLFTYEGCLTEDKAREVIKKWVSNKSLGKITSAWIDVFEGDKRTRIPVDVKETTAMTVREFCLKETNVGELVVIRDSGYIVACVWIDCEDIFTIADSVKSKVIKSASWGVINLTDKNKNHIEAPCHYLDI